MPLNKPMSKNIGLFFDYFNIALKIKKVPCGYQKWLIIVLCS